MWRVQGLDQLPYVRSTAPYGICKVIFNKRHFTTYVPGFA